jgi:hypothetical protein
MGIWTVLSMDESHRLRSDYTQVFGHALEVRFVLRYQPVAGQPYVELPRLIWGERILFKDHAAKTCWEHDGDKYAARPRARTFQPWYDAYAQVEQTLSDNPIGVRLSTLSGRVLSVAELRAALPVSKHNDLARNYLKANGGLLTITILDRPGVNVQRGMPAAPSDVERWVGFDIGVEGYAPRLRPAQYLRVRPPPHSNVEQFGGAVHYFELDAPPFRREPAPANVYTVDTSFTFR